MLILTCPICKSEIAIMSDEKTTFDIDCNCGQVITAQNYKGNYESVGEGCELCHGNGWVLDLNQKQYECPKCRA